MISFRYVGFATQFALGFWLYALFHAVGFAAPSEFVEGSVTITLQGQTKHPPLANAVIEVSAGGNTTVSGTTNAFGAYSIDFVCSDPDGLIVLRFSGVAEQAKVGAARVVHSCSYVVENSNSNKVFGVGPVSPISSALYAVTNWTLNHYESASLPWRESELRPYRHSLESFQSRYAIRILTHINNGIVDLPAGLSTSLEVVEDLGLIEEVYRDIPTIPNPTDDRLLEEIFGNKSLYRNVKAISDSFEAAEYCIGLPYRCGVASTIAGNSTGSVAWRSIGGDATFSFLAQEDSLFHSGFDETSEILRAVRAVGHNGEPIFRIVQLHDVVGKQVEYRIDQEWYELIAYDASEYIPLIGGRGRVRRYYPNNPELPSSVEEDARPTMRAGFFGVEHLPTWTAPAHGDQWILEVKTQQDDPLFNRDYFYSDRVTFNSDGSATLERLELTVQWSISNGALVLEGDGLPSHHYRLTSGDWAPQYRTMVLRVFDAGAAVGSNNAVGFPSPESEPFLESEVPGRYVNVGFRGVTHTGFPKNDISYFTLYLDTDGTGWSANLPDPLDPEPIDSIPLTWLLNARGEIVIEREFSNGYQVRSWSRLKMVGGQDLHVLEVGPSFAIPEAGYEVPFATGRLNIYRKIPL